ncbi:MAG: TIGR02221 family CRISPR-associated protein [Desulfobacula sp.]|nr:TIGR02221 family CRISPR-associated protein [Desulfobacula sp.]
MAKIFISFLGTNDYLECSYKFQNKLIKNVRFVQEATIKLHCNNWSSNDKVLIFTTKNAYQNNWKDNGHKDRKTGEYLDRIGLEKRLSDLKLNCSIKQINIPDGKNEAEIWEIFSIVFDEIEQDTEIIFDITHAFRSIPMLAIVILNYAKVIKDVSLDGLYYGAMEALGNFPDVKKIPLEKRIIPIIDLTSFDHLMEWSVGIDQFLKSGNASLVSKLAEKSARTILSRTKGRDRSQHIIRKFANNLEAFTKTLSTCRGRDISNNIVRLKINLDDCKKIKLNESLNKPLRPLLEKINRQMDSFPENFDKDGIQAAKWCLEHNLIQQGYTILQETLISYFLTRIGEDPYNFQSKNRKLVNQAVYIFFDRSPEKIDKNRSEEQKITNKLLNFYKKNKAIVETHRNLSNLRNDINHCGFNEDPAKANTLTNELKKIIQQVEKNIST